MRRWTIGLALLAGCSLSACAHGNIRSASSYDAPPAPPVKQPLFDPYGAYGSVPAVWQPPVAFRSDTIVKPNDPVDQGDRPDYEHAPWAADQKASQAGTF